MRPVQYPPVGIYEHYRSTPSSRRYYQLLGFARHTETEEVLAIYIPLYTGTSTTGLRLQARPLNMFTEDVTVDGERRQRFRFVGAEL